MKKSIKIFLLLLLICPAIILSACVPPPSYMITSSSSEPLWGRASGNKTSNMQEGTEITLVATENYAETQPFICWIKDYEKVYSLLKELPLTYSENTAGHYTAVFEDSSDKMLFATFSSIELEANGYSKITFDLKYSNSVTGSNNYKSFASGEFDPKSIFISDHSSVLYFGPLGNDVKYKFNMFITLTDNVGNQSQYELKFSQQEIINSSFSNGVFQMSETIGNTGIDMNLKFEKLSYNLLNQK